MAKKENNKKNYEGRINWIQRKQKRNQLRGKQVWFSTDGIIYYPLVQSV